MEGDRMLVEGVDCKKGSENVEWNVLRKVSNAEGFNLGMNQGAISGAGVAAHIHQHVIPRWSGDANFMPLIGQTKVLPKLLSESREEIASAWREIQ